MNAIETKTLRQEIKQKRLALESHFISEAALDFKTQIQTFFGKLTAPMKIGIYFAAKGELDLAPSTEWLWAQGHLLYAPILDHEQLVFGEYTKHSQLEPNQYNILEPKLASCLRRPSQDAENECRTEKLVSAKALDYVLVPLVAFDRQGHRLGMGKGYYDKTFAFRKTRSTPILIGCAYAFQEVENLPAQAHDIPMDLILKSS